VFLLRSRARARGRELRERVEELRPRTARGRAAQRTRSSTALKTAASPRRVARERVSERGGAHGAGEAGRAGGRRARRSVRSVGASSLVVVAFRPRSPASGAASLLLPLPAALQRAPPLQLHAQPASTRARARRTFPRRCHRPISQLDPRHPSSAPTRTPSCTTSTTTTNTSIPRRAPRASRHGAPRRALLVPGSPPSSRPRPPPQPAPRHRRRHRRPRHPRLAREPVSAHHAARAAHRARARGHGGRGPEGRGCALGRRRGRAASAGGCERQQGRRGRSGAGGRAARRSCCGRRTSGRQAGPRQRRAHDVALWVARPHDVHFDLVERVPPFLTPSRRRTGTAPRRRAARAVVPLVPLDGAARLYRAQPRHAPPAPGAPRRVGAPDAAEGGGRVGVVG